MAKRVEVTPVSDYRGGVNYQADAFQLAENEVSDAMDVDFDPSGGIARRQTVAAINTTAIGTTPRNLWTFVTADAATKQIIVQIGNTIAFSTGVNFTSAGTGAPFNVTTTGTMFAATAGNVNYIQRNGEQTALRWSGAAATSLTDPTGAYNDNLGAPVGGKMPKAKFIAYHRNYLFHANTVETATAKRSRVRFSHPASDLTTQRGFEDYRTNDWLDVAPDDGDEITGIISWNERLLIFKNKSVWQLLGYSADTWQLENITTSVGAVGRKAITAGDEGIYFFSWPQGLQLYDGKQVRDLFYPMTPLIHGEGATIDNEVISESFITNACLMYTNQRVWCAVTTGIAGSSVNDRVFVYDPRLSKAGGWTKYALPLSSMTRFQPPSGDVQFLAAHAGNGFVVKLDNNQRTTDILTYSAGVAVSTPVQGYVYTGWYDQGNPALVKRWKHPIIVADADNSIVMRLTAYRDYDFYAPVKTFDVAITAPAPGMVWDVGLWDVGVWGGSLAGPQTIVRGETLGRGTSVALKIEGPAAGTLPWSINSVTYKWIPRRIRA